MIAVVNLGFFSRTDGIKMISFMKNEFKVTYKATFFQDTEHNFFFILIGIF